MLVAENRAKRIPKAQHRSPALAKLTDIRHRECWHIARSHRGWGGQSDAQLAVAPALSHTSCSAKTFVGLQQHNETKRSEIQPRTPPVITFWRGCGWQASDSRPEGELSLHASRASDSQQC